MMNMRFVTVIFLNLFLATALWGQIQSVDPRSVDVNSLSDVQIQRLVQEMEKRGLTENEAIALARARGMNQSQIDALRRRMEELQMTSESVVSSYEGLSMSEDLEYSEKAKVDSNKIDERIFGFSFFNNEYLSFEPNVNIPVSSSYILGAGDELLIDVWGASQQSYQMEIDRNGMINIPNIGPVQVGGLTQASASKKVFSKLTLIYRDLVSEQPRTFANIHIGAVKAIKVNVIGEVMAPGTYTLPGTASAFNALYLSGGPNKNGSFRNIQVIRDGKVTTRLDVYDYLINGNSKVNIPLRENDVILIPTYDKRIEIEGEFKREGLFEAREGEVIADVIKYAGGFTENAYTHRLELYRNTSRQKSFKNILQDDYDGFELNNGDRLVAGPILERFENKVAIDGAVFRPGNYELTEGLTLSGLIEQAEGLREDAFLSRGLITRLNTDLSLKSIAFNVSEVIEGKVDFELQREDMITISSINDLHELQSVKIFGEVQLPGEFGFKEEMTLSDLIMQAGGFKESASEAFIEISRRLNYEEVKEVSDNIAHVYQFTVPRSLQLHGEDASFALQPFDQIFVRRAPGFSEMGVVRIQGEVKYAGQYSLTSKKERITDLIQRSGGLTPDAFPAGAMLTRRVVVSQKVQRLREELMEKDSSLHFSDLGFDVVSIDLSEVLANPGSKADIFLKPGDELSIPREMQTVKVSGEVLNPIATTYVKGHSLKDYVSQGGGFGLRAKKRKVYVIYPNGSAAATKRFLFFNNYPKVVPGSEVVVPQKPERTPLPATAWIAMASALASLGLTVVTIADRL
jgi:protein involved in polysaccharide export with SLBB domain